MPLYTKLEDVRLRLIGKVRFTDSDEDENKMSNALALALINEAEGEVEEALSARYMAPLQTCAGGRFGDLPVRPTQQIIKDICTLLSVVKILETDFGMGGPASGDKYARKLRERFDKLLEGRLLKRRDDTWNAWMFPPLPGLRPNYQSVADDGFSGMPINTSNLPNGESFPADRINDPSATYLNVTWDDL